MNCWQNSASSRASGLACRSFRAAASGSLRAMRVSRRRWLSWTRSWSNIMAPRRSSRTNDRAFSAKEPLRVIRVLMSDREANRFSARAARGGLKGAIMKVAQLLATIPDALPPEYVAELQRLQSEAPPMGWAFVKRRMTAELGAAWQKKFARFEHHPAAAASLGQVHRAQALDGTALACKLQYPDMQSAVEADLQQLEWLFAIRRRMDPAIDTTEIAVEIGARMREELDYRREA